ncbi:MAG: NifU family protein [Candidatus Gracilibacteria bacterium]
MIKKDSKKAKLAKKVPAKSTKKSAPKKGNLEERLSALVRNEIRPLLQMDGGDIEIVELTPKKVLKVRLKGACDGCACASVTLQYGVQHMIDEEFPGENILVELAD